MNLNFPDGLLGRIKVSGCLETLKPVLLRLAARQLRLGALIYSLRDKYLVGVSDRLCPRGGVHNIPDSGQIAMRPTELPEAEFSRMDANA